MKAAICVLGMLVGLGAAVSATAATSTGPLGQAVGNTIVADYGDKGIITGDFNADGTVDITFQDGKTSHQRWIADAHNFCMVETTPRDTTFSYHCERNELAGKQLGQQLEATGFRRQHGHHGDPATIGLTGP